MVYDTHFGLNFHDIGNTQSIIDMRFEWLEKNGMKRQLYTPFSRALTTLLNGAIGAQMSGPVAHSGDSGRSSLVTRRTRVMSTALTGLVTTAFSGQFGGALSNIPQADRELASNRTLAQMIEELSRNQTLSSFSSDRLW